MERDELAEDCFINVHSKICEYGEFMQPDEDERWLLPEIVITSLVTTILVAFLNGFLGELGKDLYSHIKEKIAGKRKLDYIEPDIMIKELSNNLFKENWDDEKMNKGQLKIKEKLLSLGISDKNATKISSEVSQIIKESYKNGK